MSPFFPFTISKCLLYYILNPLMHQILVLDFKNSVSSICLLFVPLLYCFNLDDFVLFLTGLIYIIPIFHNFSGYFCPSILSLKQILTWNLLQVQRFKKHVGILILMYFLPSHQRRCDDFRPGFSLLLGGSPLMLGALLQRWEQP